MQNYNSEIFDQTQLQTYSMKSGIVNVKFTEDQLSLLINIIGFCQAELNHFNGRLPDSNVEEILDELIKKEHTIQKRKQP
jgi:hypothetical protein